MYIQYCGTQYILMNRLGEGGKEGRKTIPIDSKRNVHTRRKKEKKEMSWVRTIAVYNNLPIEIK